MHADLFFIFIFFNAAYKNTGTQTGFKIFYNKGVTIMSKKALITGITGQDGSYLAEFLLEKGYEVHGITRRASISNTARIDHLIAKDMVTLHDGVLSDS